MQEVCSTFAEFKNVPDAVLTKLQAAIDTAVAAGQQTDTSFAHVVDSYQPRYEQFLAMIAQQNALAQDTTQQYASSIVAHKPTIMMSTSSPEKTVAYDFVTTTVPRTEHQSQELQNLIIDTVQAIKPAIMRGLDLRRQAQNTVVGFLELWRIAIITDILQDKADLELAQALFETDSIAKALEQNERLYQACVKPYLDETKKSWDDFMHLPWREQYRIVIGNIFEQLTTAVAFHAAGRIIPIARAKLPELVQFISEDKPLTVAQTAGGIKVVFEVTPEFGSAPETAVFMEAEEVAGGSAKVASGAPAAESVQQEVAQVAQLKFENFAEGRLKWHYEDHVLKKVEWGQGINMTMESYLEKACDLLNAPIGGDIEGFVSKNGYIFKYNKVTNEFATAKPNGIIETFYRPERGLTYWLEQIIKYK